MMEASMTPNATLSLSVQPLPHHPGVLMLVPIINGVSLAEMIQDFERKHGFEPAGGYGGLVPDFYKYGPLDQYFLGRCPAAAMDELRRHYVLACSCGEVGCWPLECAITADEAHVMWDSFKQPHRPDRDYSAFGPFIFKAEQYRKVVAEAVKEFRAD
jgi:hypothetical protein